jgi:hypothetical protein
MKSTQLREGLGKSRKVTRESFRRISFETQCDNAPILPKADECHAANTIPRISIRLIVLECSVLFTESASWWLQNVRTGTSASEFRFVEEYHSTLTLERLLRMAGRRLAGTGQNRRELAGSHGALFAWLRRDQEPARFVQLPRTLQTGKLRRFGVLQADESSPRLRSLDFHRRCDCQAILAPLAEMNVAQWITRYR